MLDNASTAPRRMRSALRERPHAALLALLSLVLAGGSLLPAAAAHADTATGSDWEEVVELAGYNHALTAFEDPKSGPTIIFPSDYTGDINNLQHPSDWTDSGGNTPTSWPTPTTTRSAQFTAAQVQKIIVAAVNQIEPVGSTMYYAAAHYDGTSDRIVVYTDAPSSVTDPLVAAYPGQVTIASTKAPAIQITNKKSNLDLGIDGASTTDGGAVVQQSADATANQQWRLISAGNDQYKLKNVNSGLLLGIAGGSGNAGANAVQWGDDGHDDHLWKVSTPATATSSWSTCAAGSRWTSPQPRPTPERARSRTPTTGPIPSSGS